MLGDQGSAAVCRGLPSDRIPPYSPRPSSLVLCYAAPFERRLSRWLLAKYLFSQVREPAALLQKGCPNTRQPLSCNATSTSPHTRNESDEVANQARMALTGSCTGTGHGYVSCARNNSRSEVTGNGRNDRDDDGFSDVPLMTCYLHTTRPFFG